MNTKIITYGLIAVIIIGLGVIVYDKVDFGDLLPASGNVQVNGIIEYDAGDNMYYIHIASTGEIDSPLGIANWVLGERYIEINGEMTHNGITYGPETCTVPGFGSGWDVFDINKPFVLKFDTGTTTVIDHGDILYFDFEIYEVHKILFFETERTLLNTCTAEVTIA